jgi:hypothetical protein
MHSASGKPSPRRVLMWQRISKRSSARLSWNEGVGFFITAVFSRPLNAPPIQGFCGVVARNFRTLRRDRFSAPNVEADCGSNPKAKC